MRGDATSHLIRSVLYLHGYNINIIFDLSAYFNVFNFNQISQNLDNAMQWKKNIEKTKKTKEFITKEQKPETIIFSVSRSLKYFVLFKVILAYYQKIS